MGLKRLFASYIVTQEKFESKFVMLPLEWLTKISAQDCTVFPEESVFWTQIKLHVNLPRT